MLNNKYWNTIIAIEIAIVLTVLAVEVAGG